MSVVLALMVAAAALSPQALAASCPTLPAAPPGIRHFKLLVGKLKSKTQTLAYNGTAVGPLIRLKLGEPVQIDVTNRDVPDGTSVHWHGQDQLNSSWADGVAFVSQAPIPIGATFSYRFIAQPAGTYWYHSHTGEQFGDGLRGPLIVDDPQDPQKHLYDYDLDAHVIMLADVFSTTVGQQLKKLQASGMAMPGAGAGAGGAAAKGGTGSMGGMGGADAAAPPTSCPVSVLDQDISDAPWGGMQANGLGGPGQAPLVLTVAPGKRYRLRFIGGQSSWAFKVGGPAGGAHKLQIIALDGRPVAPRAADAFVISSGERVDAVLAADRPVGNYWLDVTTLTGINSPIVVHYVGAPAPMKDAKFMGSLRANYGCAAGVGGKPGVLDLKNATFAALKTGVVPKAATKSFVLYLANAASSAPPPRTLAALLSPAVAAKTRGFRPDTTPVCPPLPDGSKTNYCWSLNWNIFELPKTPALFPKSMPGPTTYTLEVTQGDVIDIVLVNPTRMVHPQHLHGAGFWVLAAGNGEAVGPDGKLAPGVKLNLWDPPVKDTIAVPQSVGDAPSGWGYAVIRFRADNPGAWAFHCHIDLHAASGMFSVIAVRPPKGAKWFAPSGAACGAAP